MLEQISWSTYFFVIAIAALVYYLVIVLLYYRNDIMDILNNKIEKEKVDDEQGQEAAQSNQVQDLENIVDKIKGILLESGTQASKDELLVKLGQTLANFEGLYKPAFKVALNNYIIKQANELCGVRFSEEELEREWKNLPR